jgi:hypothetical protein
LANQPSLLDTNSAYQLAIQWLAKISLDVPKLERKYPPQIFQISAQRRDKDGNILPGISNNIAIPLFIIGWGDPFPRTNYLGESLPPHPPSAMSSVRMEILGTTEELLSLHVRDTNFFIQPPMRLTNVAELIGPLPPPRHFVEELLGGKDAYETVANPDKVEAWLLNTIEDQRDNEMPPERIGPKKLMSGFFGVGVDKTFSDLLLDFNSYAWSAMKLCSPDFGLRLRYTRGKDIVEFQLCYDCDILEVSHNGRIQQENFDFVHDKLVKAAQGAFPFDEKIGKLELDSQANERRKDYQRMLNQ